MSQHDNTLERYSSSQRSNHWMVAILFVLAALSGLALFHPALFWLSNLFGGGAWTRILHPFIGSAMGLFFLFLALRFMHHNFFSKNDWKWLGQWRKVIAGDEQGLPPVGRYNGGQKLLFWVMLLCMIVLVVTGVMFWRPWFAGMFPIELVRLAALCHALAAWVLIVGIMVHIYAAFWVKGTMEGMLTGRVTRLWAKYNHAEWYREMTEEKRP